MSKLIKKQVVTEVMYLGENGSIRVTYEPDNVLTQRYVATCGGITAYGSTEDAVVRNFSKKVTQSINTMEHNIAISKTNLKRYVNKLRTIKSIHHEIKDYENKSG